MTAISDFEHDYTEIEALESAYLEDSWVLSIEQVVGEVLFSLDLVLTKQHQRWRVPANDEQYCYCKAELVFRSVRTARWTFSGSRPATDVTGETDYGNIDSLRFAGDRFRLSGEWGVVVLESAAPIVRFVDN